MSACENTQDVIHVGIYDLCMVLLTSFQANFPSHDWVKVQASFFFNNYTFWTCLFYSKVHKVWVSYITEMMYVWSDSDGDILIVGYDVQGGKLWVNVGPNQEIEPMMPSLPGNCTTNVAMVSYTQNTNKNSWLSAWLQPTVEPTLRVPCRD